MVLPPFSTKLVLTFFYEEDGRRKPSKAEVEEPRGTSRVKNFSIYAEDGDDEDFGNVITTFIIQ